MITSWIMRPRDTLTESQDQRLLQVRLACPGITRVCDLARAFADLVRHRRGYLLLEWIREAELDAPKPMRGFAGFLRQDLDAVTAGLTLPWSSGVVEGHVNRVKTLKRAMYGRASFELLRTRILTQARSPRNCGPSHGLAPRKRAARRGSRRLISSSSSKSKSSPMSTTLPLSVSAPRKLLQAS
ncbi:transposase [Streptomyces ipomoeae]|nr:transposase [Streptomyces ipomoeae]